MVVELFTSQGCSSCPPADALLARLGSDPGLVGRIVPLAYHVDYWNSLGWSDPFSSAAWSRRQEDYARAFGSGRVYTPQAVIAGRAECVGSDEGELRARISEAEGRSVPDLGVRRAGDTLFVRVSPLGGAGAAGRLSVMLAIYERRHTTAVPRGENGGRALPEAFIVRRLSTAFPVREGEPVEIEVPLDLEPVWRGLELGAAVFLQNSATREILGGRSIDL